jgi:protein-disulfide isomerase
MKWFQDSWNGINNWTGSVTWPVKITIIDDKRCSACLTKEIWTQLKQVPFLTEATFEEKDFSDKGVSDYLKKNKVSLLPAFIFSTNELGNDDGMKDFLTPLPSWEFSLSVGSKFDPFVERSEKWFLTLDTKKLESLKKDAYIQGDEKAKITWLEYSDIECPFCAKFHNSWTIEYIENKYKDSLNKVFQSFPLEFHKNAFKAAQIIECAWEQWGSKKFYELIKKAYSWEKSDEKYMLWIAWDIWLDTKKIEVCLDANTYVEKIQKQIDWGKTLFWISATPGSVLINNTTGEYEIVSGALPKEAFEKVIDRLLK